MPGGTRRIYRNPRHPFALSPTSDYEIEGYPVEVRWGEISSPAVVSVGGYVFQIHEEEIELLVRPPKPRPETRSRPGLKRKLLVAGATDASL